MASCTARCATGTVLGSVHKLLRNACRDWKLKGGNPRRHDAELLLEPRLQPIECRSGCSTHCEGCERVKVCPPPRGCSALLQVNAPRNLSRLHTTMLLRTCDRHSLPGHNQMLSISLLSAASTASRLRGLSPPFLLFSTLRVQWDRLEIPPASSIPSLHLSSVINTVPRPCLGV